MLSSTGKTSIDMAVQTDLFADSDMGVDSSVQTSSSLLESSDDVPALPQGSHQQTLPLLVEKVCALEATLKNHTILLSEVISSHDVHSKSSTPYQTQASYADAVKNSKS